MVFLQSNLAQIEESRKSVAYFVRKKSSKKKERARTFFLPQRPTSFPGQGGKLQSMNRVSAASGM
jgi:hypothetical protein